MQHCLALDLADAPELIAEYEAHHRRIWPEVARHLRDCGVLEMTLYRLGTRLAMVMETDDAHFSFAALRAAAERNPRVQEWEQLMWRYQRPTPWTPEGEKWTPMQPIFRLSESP